MKKRVLVTNDDGVAAQGIQTLARALEADFDVWLVAPDREQSARSHALTLHRPLRLNALAAQRFSVDGTPADSVYLAIHHVMKGDLDLVVSGINHGANLGDDVSYSGTVSAAMEGAFMGIPAIAVSLAGHSPYQFEIAASFARTLAHEVLERPSAARTLLNVNVPNLPLEQLRGIRTTRLGHRRYNYAVEEKVDPRGRHYYWIGGSEAAVDDIEGSDGGVVRDGYISVTPLFPDRTDIPRLSTLGWIERLPILAGGVFP